jgi:hypothetical protein
LESRPVWSGRVDNSRRVAGRSGLADELQL